MSGQADLRHLSERPAEDPASTFVCDTSLLMAAYNHVTTNINSSEEE